jgi:uncharacterized membrane protein
MHEPATNVFALEASVGQWVRGVGVGIDVFGVLIIVVGIAWSTYRFLQRRMEESHYDAYKIRIGRSLLLGLEVLVAADIVKTIAIEPTFMSLGVLAGLVLVRTFLSWTLVLEIEGRWPWQRETRPQGLELETPRGRVDRYAQRTQDAAAASFDKIGSVGTS